MIDGVSHESSNELGWNWLLKKVLKIIPWIGEHLLLSLVDSLIDAMCLVAGKIMTSYFLLNLLRQNLALIRAGFRYDGN